MFDLRRKQTPRSASTTFSSFLTRSSVPHLATARPFPVPAALLWIALPSDVIAAPSLPSLYSSSPELRTSLKFLRRQRRRRLFCRIENDSRVVTTAQHLKRPDINHYQSHSIDGASPELSPDRPPNHPGQQSARIYVIICI